MRVLVLGGTAWLGAQIASTAVELGHDVTCLARGTSGSPPPGVTFVVGDRDQPDGLDGVADGRWDAVFDVSRQPGQVRRAVAALKDRSDVYVFVSTGNVYADHSQPGQDESTPLLAPLEGDVMETMETYGEAKVACEQAVIGAFGADRSLIARAGLIGGPGDVSDRSGYWPWRFARPSTPDGSVLIPDVDSPTQLIDARDLARWLVDSAASDVRGVFNTTGEVHSVKEHLELARAVAGHTGPVVAVDPAWLIEHEVEPFMGPRSLPHWMDDDPDWAGFTSRDSSKARAAGLRHRPLEQTLADTLAWELTRDPKQPRRSGLSDEDERDLLSART